MGTGSGHNFISRVAPLGMESGTLADALSKCGSLSPPVNGGGNTRLVLNGHVETS